MIVKPPGWPYLIVLPAAAAVILIWASYPYWYGIEMFLLANWSQMLWPNTPLPEKKYPVAQSSIIS